jgi:acyl carrier protein
MVIMEKAEGISKVKEILLSKDNGYFKSFLECDIKDSDTIDELGLDSLSRVEVTLDMERTIGTEISDDDVQGCITVGDLGELYTREYNKKYA